MKSAEHDRAGEPVRLVEVALPPRLGRSLLGLLVTVVLVGFGWACMGVTRFTCLRAGGVEPPPCSLVETGWLGRARTYPSGAIGAVEVEERVRAKANSAPEYCLFILDRHGGEEATGCYRRRDDAEAERARVRRYFDDPSELELRSETTLGAGPYVLLACALFMTLASVAAALEHAGTLTLRFERAKARLVIEWTLLGFVRGKRHAFALQTVTDVRLESGRASDTWRLPWSKPMSGERLVVVRTALAPAAATPYLPHPRALRAAVAQARAELGVAAFSPVELEPFVDSSVAAASQPLVDAEPRVPPEPRGSPVRERRLGWAEKPPVARAEMRFGVITTAAIVLAVALAVAVDQLAERSGATVEIDAESRCRFGGLTLMPGGSLRTTLEPGWHSIAVFNPDLPGKYETQRFEVTRGRTTFVRCRATPSPVRAPQSATGAPAGMH